MYKGVKRIGTETGAGQWGTALSFACAKFGLECEVYMVRISYDQKPYRKIMMNAFGAQVYPSPSDRTQAGRNVLQSDPTSTGSLGLAISEAIERAVANEDTKYSLGTVLNHVLMHQTIIGQECLQQLEYTGDYPDIIIAPLGGGSNFASVICSQLRRKAPPKPSFSICAAMDLSTCRRMRTILKGNCKTIISPRQNSERTLLRLRSCSRSARENAIVNLVN